MNKLLRQNRLKKRAAVLLGEWAAQGVSVSPIAHDRYWILLDQLRGSTSSRRQPTHDLHGEIQTFAGDADMLTVLGWSAEEEPAMLVSKGRLVAGLSSLDRIYPDGFFLISDASRKALLVDFDEEQGTVINILNLPASAH